MLGMINEIPPLTSSSWHVRNYKASLPGGIDVYGEYFAKIHTRYTHGSVLNTWLFFSAYINFNYTLVGAPPDVSFDGHLDLSKILFVGFVSLFLHHPTIEFPN